MDRRTQYAGRNSMGGQRCEQYVRWRKSWSLPPDVILSSGVTGLSALQKIRQIPVVFAIVSDPVGAGFVDSLARPGGNVTGFMQFEYSLGGKWVEMLKEIAPGVT